MHRRRRLLLRRTRLRTPGRAVSCWLLLHWRCRRQGAVRSPCGTVLSTGRVQSPRVHLPAWFLLPRRHFGPYCVRCGSWGILSGGDTVGRGFAMPSRRVLHRRRSRPGAVHSTGWPVLCWRQYNSPGRRLSSGVCIAAIESILHLIVFRGML
jgi:hypothetical protein